MYILYVIYVILLTVILASCGTEKNTKDTTTNQEQLSDEQSIAIGKALFGNCPKPAQKKLSRVQAEMVENGECPDYRQHIEVTGVRMNSYIAYFQEIYLTVDYDTELLAVLTFSVDEPAPDTCTFENSLALGKYNKQVSFDDARLIPGSTVNFRFCTIAGNGEYSPGMTKSFQLPE